MVLANDNVNDSIGDYLRTIGKIPLLSDEEEILLGKEVQKMMEALQAKEKAEEEAQEEMVFQEWAFLLGMREIDLSRIIDRGKKAKERMIEANLRLVVFIAKKYQTQLPLADLIQEGNLGLERGVLKFDPTKGNKLSTYIYWWIRQGMTRAIANSRAVRLPVHIGEKGSKIRKVQESLSRKSGRKPSLFEVAKEAEIEVGKVRKILQDTQPIGSLNVPIGEEGESELGDLIEDSRSIEASFEMRVLSEEMERTLNSLLTPREKRVLEYRFGFYDGQPWTLQAVGNALGVGRERVRQIQSKALKNLRVNKSSFAELLHFIH